VVDLMTAELLRHDPGFAAILEEPLDLDATPEAAFLKGRPTDGDLPARFRERFDASLEGRTSKLVDWKVNAEATLAEAVRETLGATPKVSTTTRRSPSLSIPRRIPCTGKTSSSSSTRRSSACSITRTTRSGKSSPTPPTRRTNVTG
jgi:hypothetical protein